MVDRGVGVSAEVGECLVNVLREEMPFSFVVVGVCVSGRWGGMLMMHGDGDFDGEVVRGGVWEGLPVESEGERR